MEYDFNILYYLNMYKKWWKTIVKLMAAAVFFTVIISLLIPANYVSTVTIISADSGGSQATSSIGKLLGISGFAGGTSSDDIVIAMLKSKRMAKDIASFLELNKQPKFKYKIEVSPIKSGLIIDVKGNEPLFTEKVANFAIQDLDKINGELNITPAKPIVKVLDPAFYGIRESRQIPRKVFIAGLFAFLLMSMYIFFLDYIKKLKGVS
jgi:uncharacterized protein involved in exopolysaccharide biosynthesis